MKHKKMMTTIALLLLFLLFTGPASASWYFDIAETDTNVYNILFSTEETVSLNSFMLSFNYEDYNSLDWSYTASFPSPLAELMGPAYEETDGDITNLTGISFSGSAEVTSDIVLATFTFTGTGDANLSFDLDDYNMEVYVNAVQYKATNGDNVFGAPVPVPAAAWMLGSGLLWLVGLRRRGR